MANVEYSTPPRPLQVPSAWKSLSAKDQQRLVNILVRMVLQQQPSARKEQHNERS